MSAPSTLVTPYYMHQGFAAPDLLLILLVLLLYMYIAVFKSNSKCLLPATLYSAVLKRFNLVRFGAALGASSKVVTTIYGARVRPDGPRGRFTSPAAPHGAAQAWSGLLGARWKGGGVSVTRHFFLARPLLGGAAAFVRSRGCVPLPCSST